MSGYVAGGLNAPEFPSGLEWINSGPLTMAELRGRVVLVDIWDYTCVNCLRTLPYLKQWHERYSEMGLVIIGVHTPEFGFARDSAAVREAVRRLELEYPIVLDNDYDIWNLYANQYWPRKYLIDVNGYIVYDHAGEGDYYQTERLIQQFLKRKNPHAEFPEPYRHPGSVESGGHCYPVTPELYLGYERGRIGNNEGYEPGLAVNYRDSGNYLDGYIYAHGVWLNLPQSLKHERKDKLLQDYVAINYHALSVNAVIRPAEELNYRVFVMQDEQYLTGDIRGRDVIIDGSGRSFVEVSEPRLYELVRNNQFGSHALRLFSDSSSFDLYSFTFGSCEVAMSKTGQK